MTLLTKFVRTTAFKLSLLYMGVLTAMSVFLLVYVSDNTAHLMSEQVVQSVDADLTSLSDVYVRGGLRQLVETIDQRVRHPNASLYLLVDFAGNALVGNIARLPTTVLEEANGGLRRVRYTRLGPEVEDIERQAMVRTFELQGGFRLLVGRDLGDQLRFSNLLGNALRLWLIVLVLLCVLTWVFVGRRVMLRIDDMSATSRTIMQGDLSGRLKISGDNDEFDRLAISLNAMLDRIELLMQSMKDVTDNIAHDLKTPLTRLQTRMETALREAEGEKAYREALEKSLNDSEQLLRVFNALLRIARVESMAPGSVLSATNLNILVSEVFEFYEPLVDEEGGRLEVQISENLIADCNRDLVSQVLVNLIENCLKYGRPDKGEFLIQIAAERVDDKIELSVTDNGPGIEQQDHSRVQQRFVRLEKSRSEPGTGLGLSLVKAVARLHGSDLKLENVSPGLRIAIDLNAITEDGGEGAEEHAIATAKSN